MVNVGRCTPVFRQTGEGKLENPGRSQLVSVTFVFSLLFVQLFITHVCTVHKFSWLMSVGVPPCSDKQEKENSKTWVGHNLLV